MSRCHLGGTFELFITRMTDFWPREHSIGSAEIAEVVVEPRVGGRWFERGVDGSECQWGRVAAWEPPGKVVLLWQIGADWQYDPDFETAVEVTFTEEAGGRTHLELAHRGLQRYGDATEKMRAIFDDPKGWAGTLARCRPVHRRNLMAADGSALSTMQRACDEREDFAELLAGLSPEQWERLSLCER